MIRLELTDDDKRAMVHELINFAAEKVTKHRDIARRAGTLKKLRSGKVRKEKKGTRHVGVAQEACRGTGWESGLWRRRRGLQRRERLLRRPLISNGKLIFRDIKRLIYQRGKPSALRLKLHGLLLSS